MLGANLIATRYGREAELESDAYGMEYMKEAGYDPAAAIDLQKTFVKLSEGRRQGWLEGLFASHPPSEERVEKNTEKAAQLGPGGDLGRERYQHKLAQLRKMEPAYKKYDEGVEALRKKDVATALRLAEEARRMEPREAKFYELSGDAELTRKNFREALGFYEEALRRNPNYFKPHVQSGIARLQLNDKREAQQHLERSMQLLPTAVGAYYLGQIAKDDGDINKAAEYFQMAASSDSEVGKASARELALMELPRNPAKFVRVEPRVDNQGRVWLLVQNAAPVALNGVTIAAALFDPSGRVVQGPVRVSTGREAIAPGQVGQLPTNLGPIANAEALRGLRVEIESANVAE
jgi:predicted Zn-dependent protease